MIELDFYIYVFSMELRSFEKPYVAQLNSSNMVFNEPLLFYHMYHPRQYIMATWRSPYRLVYFNPFLPVEKKKFSEISRKWRFRNFLLPLRYLTNNSFLVVTMP